ncbi:MAG: hypothetical protein JJU40_13655 [Rhodobacteraceae bacterium]|nr:hypothetical protein [Paracoccaceae bacterium]
MPIARTHELHTRRRGRNLALALSMAGFVAVVFAITIVKIQGGHLMEAFDHTPRASLMERTE